MFGRRINELGDEGLRVRKAGDAIVVAADGGWKKLTEVRSELWELSRRFAEVMELDEGGAVLSIEGRALVEGMRAHVEEAHNAIQAAIDLGSKQAE